MESVSGGKECRINLRSTSRAIPSFYSISQNEIDKHKPDETTKSWLGIRGIVQTISEDLTVRDVTQDLQIQTVKLAVVVKDVSGNPEPNQPVSFDFESARALISAGGNDYNVGIGYENGGVTTDENGVAAVTILKGTSIAQGSITASLADGTTTYNANTVMADSDVSFTLQEQTPFHTFSGTVTDSAGNPISNLLVRLYSSANSGEGTTDSSGHFSFSVPVGVYDHILVDTSSTEFSGMAGSFSIPEDLTEGDMSQDLTIQTVTLTATLKDASGNPEPNQPVSFDFDPAQAIVSAGGSDHNVNIGYENGSAITDGNGVAVATILKGVTLAPNTVTASLANGTVAYNTSGVTADSDISFVFQETIPAPSAPTGLTAPTPTNQHPLLSWNSVPDATSYNIYHDGMKIAAVTTTSYADSSASQGNHSYYVTAVNGGGESGASNSITVVYDTTGPAITITSPATGSTVSGTVVVSGTIADDLSGIQNNQVTVHLRAVKPDDGKLGAFLNTLYATVNSDGSWSVTFDSTPYADGEYGVTILANDGAGNSQTASGGASLKPFSIDNNRPVISFVTPTSFDSLYTAAPGVTATAGDGNGLALLVIHVYNSNNQLQSVGCSATAGQLLSGTLTCDLSGLVPGTYSVRAGATDNGGRNQTINSTTFVVTG